MRMHRVLGSGLSLLFGLVMGCGGGDKEAEKPPSGPIVGVLEMPVSLRVSQSAPADFADVEISPSELHVGQQPVLMLSGGLVTPADRQDTQLPKLAAALKTPLRSRLALSVSSQVPYETVALVLATAKAAGMRGVAFKVRPIGGSTTPGWLSIDDFTTQPRTKADDEVTFASITPRPWADFTSKWDDIQNACRSSATGSCAYRPEKVAEGGHLKIVLHTAGQGANVDFYQVGAPPPPDPAKKPKVELLDGVKGATVDPVKDAEEAAPATEASFQFRSQETTASPSAISGVTKLVCGTSACAVVVSSEKATLFVRVAALLGAAFPDGTPPPTVAFDMP